MPVEVVERWPLVVLQEQTVCGQAKGHGHYLQEVWVVVVHVPCQRLMVGNQVVVRWRDRVAVCQLVELEKQEQQP